jgi:hypothetical protein
MGHGSRSKTLPSESEMFSIRSHDFPSAVMFRMPLQICEFALTTLEQDSELKTFEQ